MKTISQKKIEIIWQNLFYIEAQQKLITFGAGPHKRQEIYEYNLLDESPEWKMNTRMKMTHPLIYMYDGDVILAFPHIIIVFYFEY